MSASETSVSVPLGDILGYHAARDPSKPAITHGDRTLTRAELDAASNRRARHFAAHGVIRGDFVVLALPNSIEFFECTFALWKLGAIPCPVPPKLPRNELQGVATLVTPRLVIATRPLTIESCKTLNIGNDDSADYSTDSVRTQVSPCWKAILSGGSTGLPKLIATQSAGTANPHRGGYFQQFEDTVLNPGPLYHNASFKSAHQCLFAGGHVINMERFDALQALQLIEVHRVAYVVLVPTMMLRMWRLPPEQRRGIDMSSLRVVMHLGAACPVWLKEAWIEWLGPERIVEVYGGTEGVGGTAINGSEWLQHKGSVGRPAAGCEIRILDAAGHECQRGEIGEIFFRQTAGRSADFRYIGAEARDHGDWISLGDLGRLDAAGYLYLADRRTDLIISGGVNIYPAEIEAALERHPLIRASVVIGLPDEDLGNRVHAIVQVAPADSSLSTESVFEFLEDQLVRYKIPRSIEIVTAELRDEAGKSRRAVFRQQRSSQPAGRP